MVCSGGVLMLGHFSGGGLCATRIDTIPWDMSTALRFAASQSGSEWGSVWFASLGKRLRLGTL
eukprot:113463-Amphidinium_carterae.2